MTEKPRKAQALCPRQEEEGELIDLEAIRKQTVTTSRGGQGRGPLFRLPSMLGQNNFAFVVLPCRHKKLRSLGYTLTPPTSAFRERLSLSLGDFKGLQVISQAIQPRLLWPPPRMPVTTIARLLLQQGSREAVELLA